MDTYRQVPAMALGFLRVYANRKPKTANPKTLNPVCRQVGTLRYQRFYTLLVHLPTYYDLATGLRLGQLDRVNCTRTRITLLAAALSLCTLGRVGSRYLPTLPR